MRDLTNKKEQAHSKEMLLGLYNTMLRIRAFEEHAADCFTKGMLAGNIHLSIGQEGAEAGAFAAIEPRDYFTSTHRGHGHAIARGADPKLAMLNCLANGPVIARVRAAVCTLQIWQR